MDWYITDAWYYDFHSIFFILYGMAYLIELVGYTSFKANIVQYNIDQLVGGSAECQNKYCHMILALFHYTTGMG